MTSGTDQGRSALLAEHRQWCDDLVDDEPTIRVFLVDDHEVVRDGLRALIDASDDLGVVGEAGTCAEALLGIPSVHPDVAMLDVRLPDGSGIDVCHRLRAEMPDLRILMLTSYADDEAVELAELAGADGFMIKQIRGRELLDSIRRVAAGRRLPRPRPEGARRPAVPSNPAGRPEQRLAALTPRQRQVLELVAIGRTNRQIAAELSLAEKTIKNCVSSILMTLGVGRRVEAAVLLTNESESATLSGGPNGPVDAPSHAGG